MGFWKEIRRRHIIRVAVAYAATAWLLLQLGAIVFPIVRAPDWCEGVLLGFLILFFPVALIFAWAFELTPEGVRRTPPASDPGPRIRHNRRRMVQALNVAIIVSLAAAVGVLAWRLTSSRGPVTQPMSAKAPAPASASAVNAKSIAVLPFENLSADKDNAYFASGIQGLIMTKLADIGELQVTSRTSTQKYASHPSDLKVIARQLGVATILEGSVQKAGDQVLINVQLIDARTDRHLWAHAYTRSLQNVFGVEGEVAEKIASALKANLTPADNAKLATALSGNSKANILFLRAEYSAKSSLNNVDVEALQSAVKLYRQAIEADPGFALARARLSIAETTLARNLSGTEKTRLLNADARAQAKQALALQPDLFNAHLALGYNDYFARGDDKSALAAFATALRERPNNSEALLATGLVKQWQGQLDEAAAVLHRAVNLDPRNPAISGQLGFTYMMGGHYRKAVKYFRRSLALDPGGVRVKYLLSRAILYGSGDIEKALSVAQGDDLNLIAARVHLLELGRKYPAAINLLHGLLDRDPESRAMGALTLTLANLYRLGGDSRHAQPLFEEALAFYRAQVDSPKVDDGAIALCWTDIADAELGLGHTKAALAALEKAQALASGLGDRYTRALITLNNAKLYAQAGVAERAVPLIELALAMPAGGVVAPRSTLWVNPVWDPIRKNPGFLALQEKYAKYRPSDIEGATYDDDT